VTGIRLSRGHALVWILCLASLAVGARNFELGLSVDAPVYASIARHMVKSGDWFYMYGGVPDFMPFAEHPHLGFWMIASCFKVLPIADWSARIPGHLFYVGFLFVFFLYLREVAGQKSAIWAVLLLWSWYRFANFFSNVYLDPGALFFGSSAIFALDLAFRRVSAGWALVSGIALGLCVMDKGAVIVGFLPVMGLIAVLGFRKAPLLIVIPVLVAAAVFSLYAGAIHWSSVPDFITRYFSNQLGKRVGGGWQWSRLVEWKFWKGLCQDTNWFAPLVVFSVIDGFRRREVWMALLLLVPFLTIYACEGLWGHQYWLTVLPWVAWLLAEEMGKRIPWDPARAVVPTAALALVLMFIAQYAPIRTHGVMPPAETARAHTLLEAQHRHHFIVDNFPAETNVGQSGVYAWYVGDVQYPRSLGYIPAADDDTLLLTLNPPDRVRRDKIAAAGWCPDTEAQGRQLWVPCLSSQFDR